MKVCRLRRSDTEREVLAKRIMRPGFPSNVANHAIKIIFNNHAVFYDGVMSGSVCMTAYY